MGLRGPQPQPDRKGSRVVHRPKKTDRRLAGIVVPPMPKDLLVQTKAWWAAFWESSIARQVKPTDLPALERLAHLYDDRERSRRAVRSGGRLVSGSMGQPVLNPLIKYVEQLDKEIRALEDRFGLTPKARLALGLQLTEGMRQLEDLIDGDEDSEADTGGNPPQVIEIGDAGGDLAAPDRPVRRPRQRRS